MSLSGNFGSVSLEGDRVRAIGNSVDIGGFDTVSLHVAIVQGDGVLVHGPAQVSGGTWVTDPPLPDGGLAEGAALGLASQTVVNVAEGTPPSFLTFTWSEQLTITSKGA